MGFSGAVPRFSGQISSYTRRLSAWYVVTDVKQILVSKSFLMSILAFQLQIHMWAYSEDISMLFICSFLCHMFSIDVSLIHITLVFYLYCFINILASLNRSGAGKDHEISSSFEDPKAITVYRLLQQVSSALMSFFKY